MKTGSRLSKICLIWCLLFTAGFSLSACGFKPLYADKTLATERNASILIMPVNETSGNYIASQHLHNLLRDRLNPRGMPTDADYRLAVDLSQTIGALSGDVAEETLRKFLDVKATYKLIDARNGRDLYTATAISRIHYDVFDKNYDSVPAKTAAERNVLKQIADDISRAITLRLAKI